MKEREKRGGGGGGGWCWGYAEAERGGRGVAVCLSPSRTHLSIYRFDQGSRKGTMRWGRGLAFFLLLPHPLFRPPGSNRERGGRQASLSRNPSPASSWCRSTPLSCLYCFITPRAGGLPRGNGRRSEQLSLHSSLHEVPRTAGINRFRRTRGLPEGSSLRGNWDRLLGFSGSF